MDIKELFLLNKFITPKIITVIYWLIIVVSIFAGMGLIFAPAPYGSVIQGLLIIFGGILFGRVWCELTLIFFRINENLEKLNTKNSQ